MHYKIYIYKKIHINKKKNNNDISANANQDRSILGFPHINYIWCYICHSLNQQFWWNYLSLRCKIYHQNHRASDCPIRLACQRYDSTNHI